MARSEIKKRVLFIEHPQTSQTDHHIQLFRRHQITPKGRAQIPGILERVARFKPEAIIAGSLPRHAELASAIAVKFGLEVQYRAYFADEWRRRPSICKDRNMRDPDMVKLKIEQEEGYERGGYKHSDEETFEDEGLRVKSVLNLLMNHEQSRICIVTSQNHLRAIITTVLGKRLSFEFWEAIERNVIIEYGSMVCLVLREGYRYEERGNPEDKLYWHLVFDPDSVF